MLGKDITSRSRGKWIIDFGVDMSAEAASLYETPFEYVKKHVRPDREKNNRQSYALRWWLFGEPRPAMRKAISKLSRYIATSMVAKHRIFVWVSPEVISENLITVIAREDDYFFGVLHSRVHDLWSRRMGTQLREVESGFRYTASTTFETFPFPWPPGTEPKDDPRVKAIAATAKDLVAKRDAWLNPAGASAGELKKRTLTNLYNQRPQWLDDVHRALDKAVLAAYGWPEDIRDAEILERLLALNQSRARL